MAILLYSSLIQIFCSRLMFISWLQNHLIPCPFKYLTGIDCPGCGFQRAMIALLKGNLQQSFTLYPAAIPLVAFLLFGLADKLWKLDTPKSSITKSAFIMVSAMILVSYVLKMTHLYLHYKASVA